MLSSSLLRPQLRSLSQTLPRVYRKNAVRLLTNASKSKGDPTPQQPKSWLTQKVETSPVAKYWFMKITSLLGFHSPKHLAGIRALGLYQHVCAVMPDAQREFWQNECDLPLTFQSWFTITNLHLWMLTVRLRALPEPHGKYYVQFLLDHFFLDIEDRIRAILQPSIPPRDPYTFFSPFYVNPNIPKDGKLKRGSRAPERLVTRQLKIFKEQWMGMGMWFDYGLVTSDMELASTVWRNLLGARGSQGIAYPGTNGPKFRRAVNLVGGGVVDPAKIDLEKEETRDDGSGVHDYPPEEVDKYVRYPELMLDLVTYLRREIARLEKISDQEIMEGGIKALKFGPRDMTQATSVDPDAAVIYNYHRLHHQLAPASAIFCLCSLDTRVAVRAAELFRTGYAPLLIFSGGVGILTEGLFDGVPEAEAFAAIARKMGVPDAAIVVEPRSTNTGENVRYTYALLKERGLLESIQSFILVQKPYMERRTYATFVKQWPGQGVEFRVTSPKVEWDEYPDADNPRELVISIMVGDLVRIRDYPAKGYQIAQEIPADVWEAGERLISAGYSRHLPS